MIPKKIHYCWFGRGEKSKLTERCIKSWKKYCVDYEIIEWNEDNFDINIHPYTKYCYENKKWAFLSDYVRLWVVEKYGGLYFDTDVEAIKSFDELLQYDGFYGFENPNYVASGLEFGSIAHHITVRKMLEKYDELVLKNEEVKLTGCPLLNTEALLPLGLKLTGKKHVIEGTKILPSEYLNPLEDSTGIVRKTENTLSIHWYAKSALDKNTILRSKLTRPMHRLFGKNCFSFLKRILHR